MSHALDAKLRFAVTFLAAAGLAFIASCDNDPGLVITIPCKPLSLNFVNNNSYTLNYTYDGNNLATHTAFLVYDGKLHESIATLSYDNNNNVIGVDYGAEGHDVLSVENNLIVKRERYTPADVLYQRVEYEYNGNKQLIEISDFRGASPSQMFLHLRRELEYNNGLDLDPSKVSHFPSSSSVPGDVATYTYEQSASPYHALTGGLKNYFQTGGDLAVLFNIRRIDHTAAGQVLDFSYELNEHGYATKMTMKSDGKVTESRTYSYECLQ